MNTLWAFGDSFTYGHGCRPDGPLSEYYHKYKKDNDKIWVEWLGEWLNVETKNFGVCGASNDYIIDSIIDQWDGIKKNDFVFIGMSWFHRFDVPKNNKLTTIYWNSESKNEQKSVYSEEEIETIINFQYYFAGNELYKNRYLKRYNFLVKILQERGVKTYFWDITRYARYSQFEKIADATNLEIEDSHWSFKGHKDFAKTTLKKITQNNII